MYLSQISAQNKKRLKRKNRHEWQLLLLYQYLAMNTQNEKLANLNVDIEWLFSGQYLEWYEITVMIMLKLLK